MPLSPERRRFVGSALALGATPTLSSLAAPALAADWPVRPIRLVVGVAAGGLADAMSRAYAAYLSTRLGQQMIVEMKPGAGSIIACQEVARAPADGYTLLYTISTAYVQNTVLYSKLPYDPDKDFSYISVLNAGSLPLCIDAKIPATNFREFMAWAKGREITMGTYAAGSFPHMIAARMNKLYGMKVTAVHYRGEAQMWQDVAGGVVTLALGSYQGVSPRLQSNSLRPIAAFGPRRMSKLPDVATLEEQG
ncbi:MAG TPA: tripartite tricarboxylate transporter substrate binding protein, partial [Burkholderiaceae bacterium]|nr:tripartite tricarboxylate transporter substrate binding protein [Burkholderiaceae bacterium]